MSAAGIDPSLTATGITIDVVGTPVPQGQISHSATGHAYSTNGKRLKPWRAAIAKAVTRQAADVATLDAPLTASLVVYLERPKKHYRTGKFAHILRDDAPDWPTSHQLGDIDKHERAIFDALTEAGLVADDSLIVMSSTLKVWADGRPPGAEIRIAPAPPLRAIPDEVRTMTPDLAELRRRHAALTPFALRFLPGGPGGDPYIALAGEDGSPLSESGFDAVLLFAEIAAADLPALLDAAAERDALAAKVERVRALHFGEYVEDEDRNRCFECGDDWPCPTVRAMDEEPQL